MSVVLVVLFASLQLHATHAPLPAQESTPVSFLYLPLVAYCPVCPTQSLNVYESGIAYQYDSDNPVRPAVSHADKNIELRGYTVAMDPALSPQLVDYGCDDEGAPQLGTLFAPSRLPPLTALYQVHNWEWRPSPAPGERVGPIASPPVTAISLLTTPGEPLHVPASGYSIGGGMEVILLFADEDTVALRYGREDSSAPPGYTLHLDGICTDPNLLDLYQALDNPDGSRYEYPKASYALPTLAAHQELGVARGTAVVVAIADTGTFQDPRSGREFWREEWSYLWGGVRVSDPYYAKQWSLDRTHTPRAWGLSRGGASVIAILDTGVDLDHPDLAAKLLTDTGRDFVNNDTTADDDHGHGTHVAGIAAAVTDNELGVAGVAWESKILPLKVLGPNGDGSATGTIPDLTAAVRYAADQGVDVINLSLGAPGISCSPVNGDVPAFAEAVEYAYQRGIVIVAAAGNDGKGAEMFPANCEHVFGVAATDRDDAHASYSNWGAHVSVAAPGGVDGCATCRIYSTVRGGSYGWLAGTSMATPHVAALAALVADRYPMYGPGQVASAILDNAFDLGTAGWDDRFGCGRIDAFASLFTGAHGPQPLCLESRNWSDAETLSQPVPDPLFVPGEIILALESDSTAASLGDELDARLRPLPGLDLWSLRVPLGEEATVLAQLRANPAVRHAGLNYLVFAQ